MATLCFILGMLSLTPAITAQQLQPYANFTACPICSALDDVVCDAVTGLPYRNRCFLLCRTQQINAVPCTEPPTTAEPTASPTREPTTAAPTSAPTASPTQAPSTASPTSGAPTVTPTVSPSHAPCPTSQYEVLPGECRDCSSCIAGDVPILACSSNRDTVCGTPDAGRGPSFADESVCSLCNGSVNDQLCDARTNVAYRNRCFLFCITGDPTIGVACGTLTDFPTAAPTAQPTAAPTPFDGTCPPHQFIPFGERRCVNTTECPPNQFEVVAPTLTSDRFCYTARTCSATQFTAAPATPTTDTDCRDCSVCDDSQVEAETCAGTRNTVCVDDDTGRNVSNASIPCSGRCEFDSTAQVCKPAGTDTACPAFAIADCPMSRCTLANVSGTPTCVPLDPVAPTATVISSFYCLDNQVRATCDAIQHCQWNVLTATCEDIPCGQAFTSASCMNLPGCSYDTELLVCYDDRRPIPCAAQWIETRCRASAGQCNWDASDSRCTAVPPPGPVPCSQFRNTSTCPSGRCTFIEGPGCTASDEVPACSSYTSATDCPGPNTEYAMGLAGDGGALCRPLSPLGCAHGYYQTRPTATTDRSCVVLTTCQAHEFQSTPPTSSTDRVCSLAATECPDTVTHSTTVAPGEAQLEQQPGEAPIDIPDSGSGLVLPSYFVGAPATPTTDLLCLPVTECGPNEYETAFPTSTSNRVCRQAMMCLTPLQFETVAATPTSDRRCQNVTECSETEYQVRAASLVSDRVCASLSVCNVPREFEDVAPTYVGGMAVTNRRCGVVTTCSDGEFMVSPATPTSDTQCRTFTQCAPGTIEVCPPVPWNDRVCRPASELDGLELGGDDGSGGSSSELSGLSPEELTQALRERYNCQSTTSTTTTATTSTATSSTTTSTSTLTSVSTTTITTSTVSSTTDSSTTTSSTTTTESTSTVSTTTASSTTRTSTTSTGTTTTSVTSSTVSSTTSTSTVSSTTTSSSTVSSTTATTTTMTTTTTSTTTSTDTLHERLGLTAGDGTFVCGNARTNCMQERGCSACVGMGIGRSTVVSCLQMNNAYRRYIASCAPLCNSSREIVADRVHSAFDCYMILLGSDALEGTSRLTPSCLANPTLARVLDVCPADSLSITANWHTALIGGGSIGGGTNGGTQTNNQATDSNNASAGVDVVWIVVYCVAGIILIGFVLVVLACRQARERDNIETIQAEADQEFQISVQRLAWESRTDGKVGPGGGLSETSFSSASATTHGRSPTTLVNPAYSSTEYTTGGVPPHVVDSAENDPRPDYNYQGMPGGRLTRKLSFNVGSLEDYCAERVTANGGNSELDSSGQVWSTAL